MSLIARGRARLASSIAAAVALAATSSSTTRTFTTSSLPTSRIFVSTASASSIGKAVMLMTATVALSSSSVATATATAALAAPTVPDHLLLSPELEAYPIQDVSLRAIDASIAGATAVKEADESVRLHDVVLSHSGSVGTVAFVVRRPGCQLCREHGRHPSELAVSDFGNQFGLFGVVKETSVDDEGLIDFVQQYFSFDVYRDEGLLLYSALGNRNIFSLTTWNPFRWYRYLKDVSARLHAKNITGNFKGEGTIQGGILIFDRTGTLRFAYEEQTGEELDANAIRAALRFLEHEHSAGVGAGAGGASDKVADPASISQVKEDL